MASVMTTALMPVTADHQSEAPWAVTGDGGESSDADFRVDTPLPDFSYSFIGIYLTLACSLSLVGNVILMISMVQTGVWRRPAVNLYVFTINVGALIETVAGFPLVITSNFNGRWMYGQLGCQYYAFITYTCVLTSMTCYLLVSVHRYRVVVLHVQGDSAETRRWIACSIAGAWTYALCWSVCPFLGFGSFGLEPFGTSCSLHWTTKVLSAKMYNIFVFIFLLLLPVSAMLWFSTRVMRKLSLQVGNGSIPIGTSIDSGGGGGGGGGGEASLNLGTVIQTRSLKIIVTTLLMFVLFWSPYGVMSMLANFDVAINPHLSALPTIMAKTHCAINPVVYFVCFRHYRLPVRELFGLEMRT